MAEQVAYCCDCLEYMKGLPDNSFDLAVVDPPYGDAISSQTVNVERERERAADTTGSAGGSTGTRYRTDHLHSSQRSRERERVTASQEPVERGRASMPKKSLRGTLRRGRSILTNCSASHGTRSYGVATISTFHQHDVFWYGAN